ncbi:tetratricopeptide repeat protein [Chryseotalea sanaruensis]|uniref:histidine kinase n=1 Tax=Chryseotalea sanaruensis TaxID=2482724 RepID=A0A401U6C0_9BACT|nr:tetratricopeptide repeat-containing sensor histidine kinase [Chryseotalea sanaruensis]GCC50427.1 tetratricopeptide repeat protein [Chryseotalea sanaruensis]
MHKFLPVLILLVITSFNLFAQNLEIDSLLRANIPEKEKVDALNQTAFQYLSYDSINTAKYANQAISLAEKIKYTEGVADAYYAIGWVTMVFGHNTEALDIFSKVLNISVASTYLKGQANAHNGLGDANRNMGNYTESLDHHLQALKLRESFGDKNRVASSLNNIGIIYYAQKEYSKALEYYTKGLELRIESGDQRQIAVSYNNIGIVYVAQQDFQKALDYYKKCLEINLAIGNKADVARNYHNIGVVYVDHIKDYNLGQEYYFKALSVYQELGDKGSMTYPLIGIGLAYIMTDDLINARKYILEGIKLSEEAKLLSNLNEGLKGLALIEEKAGNYKAAYLAHVRYKELSDRLINEEQTRELDLKEAEFKFQIERDSIEMEKVAILDELKRERIVQYTSFGGVAILLTLLVILYQFYKVKKKSNLALIAKNEEIKSHRDELVKLNNAKTRFFSIISHDLRSPVNTFFGMFELISLHLHQKYQAHDDRELNDMIGLLKKAGNQLTTLLNNLITWALKEEGMMPYNPQVLNIHECLKENLTFIELQALSKHIQVELKADVNITAWADRNSFMTILRNLTSNALKFTPSGGTIILSAEKISDLVAIKIQDSGVGIPENKLTEIFEVNENKTTRGTEGEKGTGLGLNLVYDFVKLNKGDISVESTPGKGTTFAIELPTITSSI